MACGLVFVNPLFIGNTVNNGNRPGKNGGCRFLVTHFNCLFDRLDCRTQCRTLAGIVRIPFKCLTSAFACLRGICHIEKS